MVRAPLHHHHHHHDKHLPDQRVSTAGTDAPQPASTRIGPEAGPGPGGGPRAGVGRGSPPAAVCRRILLSVH